MRFASRGVHCSRSALSDATRQAGEVARYKKHRPRRRCFHAHDEKQAPQFGSIPSRLRRRAYSERLGGGPSRSSGRPAGGFELR